MRVLVVCSGNICRSPMAAAYLRRRIAHTPLAHTIVDSAGTLGIEAAAADRHARKAMDEISIPIEDHRSRGIRASDLNSSDWVLVMDHAHLEWLAQHHPHGAGERMLLRAFEQGPTPDPDAPDLEDPIGQSLGKFRQQRDLIVRCIDHFIQHLKRLELQSR